MELSANAVKILESRYLLKNEQGQIIESSSQLFKRVANHIAKAELNFGNTLEVQKWEERFEKIMLELKFLPNSPTLMNAGTLSGQLSACFVLPVPDTIEGIFTSLKNAALIHQSGGGTGFNFSFLRPKGDFISASSGNSSGPISFMKVFDTATENIKQGGKRRGANMGILNIDHPDIEEFIDVKKSEKELQNFNISVGITDDFMEAVKRDLNWNLKHPNTGKVLKTIKAKYLWDLLTQNAWECGDPGLIFLDTINRSNPTLQIGSIISTNPCGEVPLLAYEACNLGSIDVSKFFHPQKKELDWNELESVISTSIRFLDNVIEINNYILPEIKDITTGNRKIGLGIMGWADLLIQLEMPYASREAIELAKKLMLFMKEKSHAASIMLAKERGTFKNWEKSSFYPNTPLRNATCTSIAPTGTISIIANTSSSIEPLFALAIRRENVLNNETLTEMNPLLIEYLKSKNLHTDHLIDQVVKEGTIINTNLPENIKYLFKTSHEIEPIWHLKHQLAFQEYTDNAVSKTINLASTATIKDVGDAYMYAWENSAKGITIFRDGSKQKQVLHMGLSPEQNFCKVCRN